MNMEQEYLTPHEVQLAGWRGQTLLHVIYHRDTNISATVMNRVFPFFSKYLLLNNWSLIHMKTLNYLLFRSRCSSCLKQGSVPLITFWILKINVYIIHYHFSDSLLYAFQIYSVHFLLTRTNCERRILPIHNCLNVWQYINKFGFKIWTTLVAIPNFYHLCLNIIHSYIQITSKWHTIIPDSLIYKSLLYIFCWESWWGETVFNTDFICLLNIWFWNKIK